MDRRSSKSKKNEEAVRTAISTIAYKEFYTITTDSLSIHHVFCCRSRRKLIENRMRIAMMKKNTQQQRKYLVYQKQ